jgi:ketosteroid isomerase-like protein
MSQENVDWLRQAYERFNATGQLDLDVLTDDFVQTAPDDLLGGGLHGRDAWAAQAREFTDTFDDLRVEVEDMLDLGERVLAFVRFRGRAHSSGIPLDLFVAHVWTFRGERIAAQDVYLDRSEALKAVGLRASPDEP